MEEIKEYVIVVERLLESSDLAPVTYLITTDPGVSTTNRTKNLKVWEYHSTIIVTDVSLYTNIRSTNNTHPIQIYTRTLSLSIF